MQRRPGLVHLRNGGTSVILDARHTALPAIVFWGEDQGDLSEGELAAVGTAALPQRVSGGLDQPAPLTLIPQESSGWCCAIGDPSPRLFHSDTKRRNSTHSLPAGRPDSQG